MGKQKTGRPKAKDGKNYHYQFRMNERENMVFMEKLKQAGYQKNRSKFIVKLILDGGISVVNSEKSEGNYPSVLNDFSLQIRKIGVNYNQVVRKLHSETRDDKIMKYLSELINLTRRLSHFSGIIQRILEGARNDS
ncbi:MAG: hypothetical protein LUF87_02025 [Alistipes sp.]|nr:hypothetical protein [Alistipes sp.]